MDISNLSALEQLFVSQLLPYPVCVGLTPQGQLVSMILDFLISRVGLTHQEAWELTLQYVFPLWHEIKTVIERRTQQATTLEETHG